MLRAHCGDREALELLLRSVQPALHRCLCGMVGRSFADDVQQEVLIVICRKLSSLHRPELFRAWMYRVAYRAAFRHLKRERRWSDQLRDESILDQLPTPEWVPSSEMLLDILSENLISPACRAVLVLHFQEELPLQEVAAILAIPLGTAKSRLAYGLSAMRKNLKPNRSL